MERRLALATAGAVAATLGIATVCAAALGGGSLLGLGSDASAAQIVPGPAVEQVTKVVVVHSSDSSVVDPATTPAPGVVVEPAVVSPAATPTPAVPVVGTAAPAPTTVASPPPVVTTKVTTATTAKPTATTAKPVTTTSAAPVTTNAPTTNAPTTTAKPTPTTVRRPPGVPADWPAGKPIPPMPAGCQDPQLELNGVWNCDD